MSHTYRFFVAVFHVLNLAVLALLSPVDYTTRATCGNGYVKRESLDGFTLCEPQCPDTCPPNSFCSAPSNCDCLPGYHRRDARCLPDLLHGHRWHNSAIVICGVMLLVLLAIISCSFAMRLRRSMYTQVFDAKGDFYQGYQAARNL